jgi:hypothetical protein
MHALGRDADHAACACAQRGRAATSASAVSIAAPSAVAARDTEVIGVGVAGTTQATGTMVHMAGQATMAEAPWAYNRVNVVSICLTVITMTSCYEDFTVGTRYPTYSRTITEGDHSLFCALVGYHVPLFIDEEFARKTPYGGQICPSHLIMSFSTGMTESLIRTRSSLQPTA